MVSHRFSLVRVVIASVGETGASPPTGHVRHLALTSLPFLLWKFRKYDTVSHSSMHFPRTYEACKSKSETLRDENVFLELKVKTDRFYLYQIYKLFTVIYQTCVVPKYSVCIIVSDCLLFITLFDNLDLYFKLKHHYPSWGKSAYGQFHGKGCIFLQVKIAENKANILSICVYIGVGILYPPIGVIHRYDDTTFQQFICYGHKSIDK